MIQEIHALRSGEVCMYLRDKRVIPVVMEIFDLLV